MVDVRSSEQVVRDVSLQGIGVVVTPRHGRLDAIDLADKLLGEGVLRIRIALDLVIWIHISIGDIERNADSGLLSPDHCQVVDQAAPLELRLFTAVHCEPVP